MCLIMKMTDLEKLASIHPFLPAKAKMDEEERQRQESPDCLKFRLVYEKTYEGGSTDSYDSSISARNMTEAIHLAERKLSLKEVLAHGATYISDAVLIGPSGEEGYIPEFSRKLRDDKKR